MLERGLKFLGSFPEFLDTVFGYAGVEQLLENNKIDLEDVVKPLSSLSTRFFTKNLQNFPPLPIDSTSSSTAPHIGFRFIPRIGAPADGTSFIFRTLRSVGAHRNGSVWPEYETNCWNAFLSADNAWPKRNVSIFSIWVWISDFPESGEHFLIQTVKIRGWKFYVKFETQN